MKVRKCDFCMCDILDKGASFTIQGVGNYDLCETCIAIVRTAICRNCHGTGTVREVDHQASDAQATCGENRTVYRTIKCLGCK